MPRLSADVWLGGAVILFGAFLLVVLIPVGVTTPGNIRVAVLSPTIWPNIIAVLLMLIGAILMVRGFLGGPEEAGEAPVAQSGWRPWVRIGVAAILMAGLFLFLPLLGMPLASMITLFAYAVLVRSGRPVLTILTAILLPLMIYGFFSKVAGVPIPQGQLVRLP